MSRVSLEFNRQRSHRNIWGRKDEEFVADFINISRRTLSDFEYKVFRYHFLLGGDWKLCCRKLNIDKGDFFHWVYRTQQKLGRAYRETEPYGLFPLDEYFGGSYRDEMVTTAKIEPIRPQRASLSGRVPLRKIA